MLKNTLEYLKLLVTERHNREMTDSVPKLLSQACAEYFFLNYEIIESIYFFK